MSEAELIHSLNYRSEKLFKVIDTYDNQLYPIKKKDPEKFNEIMTQVYKNANKSKISGKRLNNWIENFPNMIDRKMETEKKKLKAKLKAPKKVKAGKKGYITSQPRNEALLSKMDKLGYSSVNTESKMDKMKAGLKDDEIIADLVEEISDPYGGDHDMVEVRYDDQFKRHIEEYEDRYKYVYAVEDIEPKKKEKKDVLIRKDIISVPKKPKKIEVLPKKITPPKPYDTHTIKIGDFRPIGKAKTKYCTICGTSGRKLLSESCIKVKKKPKKEKRPIKITPVKKPIREKIKLFSSIILSENPIKITPAEKLEYVKKKPPAKKQPSIKKKPISKKPPTIKEKKPTVKKKPPAKKKPSIKKKPIPKKPLVKKPPVKKKKPIVKKKPVTKKKPPVKKKPIPKKPLVKKPPVKKKKPIVKKKTIKKAPIKKKKPPIKKKPIVKKKKPVKKPLVKKRPPIKKKHVVKKKPKPKVKKMRAKRRNSPITGRWTARYRIINGKRRKVKIRRFKGKIQTRIINRG